MSELEEFSPGASGFSWARAVEAHKAQVLDTGLRIWLSILALVLLIFGLLSLTRGFAAPAISPRIYAISAVTLVSLSLGYAARPYSGRPSPRSSSLIGGILTLLSAVYISFSSIQGGYGPEIPYGTILLLLVGLPMTLPMSIPLGITLLTATALVHPVLMGVMSEGPLQALPMSGHLTDLGAGLGLAILILVLHNILFDERWLALKALANTAEHDGLTGLLNRRAFANRLQAEEVRARRYGTPLSLIMIDLDAFKALNTRVGYTAGDAMLKAVGITLQSIVEEPRHHALGAFVARYGGEEFIVLAASPDAKRVADLAEEIRLRLAALRVPYTQGQRLSLTASLGLASTSQVDNWRLESLLARADAALYQAKADGGNRLVVAPPPTVVRTPTGDQAVVPTSSGNIPIASIIARSDLLAPQPSHSATGPMPALRAGEATDDQMMHGRGFRWLLVGTAAWLGIHGLMDLGEVPGPSSPFVFAALPAFVSARLLLALGFGALALAGPRIPAWSRLSGLMHSLFLVFLSLGTLWVMEQTGGIQSRYYGQLIFIIVSWSLALSIRLRYSSMILLATIASILFWYAWGGGLDYGNHEVVLRVSLLLGAGAVALRTQYTFNRLRAQESAARDALGELARTDPLTRLLNRTALEDQAPSLIARANDQAPLSLLIVDMDHFKQVNDRFGHPAGDQALRAVAVCLSDGLRAGDLLARLGGEEFAIVLPMTDGEGAFQTAERLRKAIGELQVQGGKIPLSASVGIATHRDGNDLSEILVCADTALRKAKSDGRNRSELYRP